MPAAKSPTMKDCFGLLPTEVEQLIYSCLSARETCRMALVNKRCGSSVRSRLILEPLFSRYVPAVAKEDLCYISVENFQKILAFVREWQLKSDCIDMFFSKGVWETAGFGVGEVEYSWAELDHYPECDPDYDNRDFSKCVCGRQDVDQNFWDVQAASPYDLTNQFYILEHLVGTDKVPNIDVMLVCEMFSKEITWAGDCTMIEKLQQGNEGIVDEIIDYLRQSFTNRCENAVKDLYGGYETNLLYYMEACIFWAPNISTMGGEYPDERLAFIAFPQLWLVPDELVCVRFGQNAGKLGKVVAYEPGQGKVTIAVKRGRGFSRAHYEVLVSSLGIHDSSFKSFKDTMAADLIRQATG